MRIFLTGGNGFIGKHLLPLLDRHEVLCLSHSALATDTLRTIRGDLNTPASYADELERFKPECCVHLAWSGLPDYSLASCRMNLLAGISLFEMLGRIGCGKVFSAGTCWEYGTLQGSVMEEMHGQEVNLFAAFKSALQTLGQSICAVSGSRFGWGRLFFVYGPGQRPASLIPSCYRSFKQGLAPKISNPLAINDFVHVTDVAAAICRLVEADDAAGIFNIGSGRPIAVWEVVNLVAAQMGLPPAYVDMPATASGFWSDRAKARALGWQPELSLPDGIAKTLSALEAEQ